ncbi:hypothetical protein CRYUN_Cryun06bG0111400 [Craigia yunnanensis]
MATFTSWSHTFVSPHSFLTHFSTRVFSSCFCGVNPEKKANLVSLRLNLVRGLEFTEEKKRVSWWSCWCKKGWEDGDLALEAEILEFMTNSEKPEVFPSKKELVDAGRLDLVEGIKRQGGWLAMGWDLDDDKGNGFQENGFSEDGVKDSDFMGKEKERDGETFQEWVQSEIEISGGTSALAVNSSCSPSSSGRSLEVVAEDECGIEGILSRLERERNMNFGFGFREKGDNTCFQSNDYEDKNLVDASKDAAVGGPGRRKLVSFSYNTDLVNDNGVKSSWNQVFSGIDGFRNPTRREWSLQRSGFAGKEFEGDETLEIKDKSSELDGRKVSRASEIEINHNEIRTRLEYLKLELSSVLQSLRSNVDEVLSREEFQENEIMNAQDRLRSIRARLVVSEGKISLAIIDTQKMVEEKQKRIDDTRRALQLLTACIVWSNSASEVLLTGSFDGWATKRKMEKSSTGVFSVCLKLYPGKYEIKFIVDGEWMIDPLRLLLTTMDMRIIY